MRIKEFETKDGAVIEITDEALLKIFGLVMACQQEVGWHGSAVKTGEGRYRIDDIYLYPQAVTGASIRCENDGLEYGRWEQLMIINEPEKAMNRRFHGHSHVTFGVIPSCTDLDLQKDIIEMTPEDDFYIFLIINKNMDMYWRIADGEEKCIYTSAVIDNNSMIDILKEHIEMVKENK